MHYFVETSILNEMILIMIFVTTAVILGNNDSSSFQKYKPPPQTKNLLSNMNIVILHWLLT